MIYNDLAYRAQKKKLPICCKSTFTHILSYDRYFFHNQSYIRVQNVERKEKYILSWK